jgi:integrase
VPASAGAQRGESGLDPQTPGRRARRVGRAQAARFLECFHGAGPLFADLVEPLIGTGLRKGEALGLHWAHVDLQRRVLFVRWTLSAIDNNHHLSLTVPKTKGSRAWVALSDRGTAALEHFARNRGPLAADYLEGGYVLHRADGKPLHPQYVLNDFHDLSARAAVPCITVHDLCDT